MDNYHKSIFNTILKEELIQIISKCNSISSVLKYFNMNPQGSSRKTFLKRCKRDDINPELLIHTNPRHSKQVTNEDAFVENSNYTRKNLKRKILNQNLIKEECDNCKLSPL